jgi:hypothetical protein
MLRLILQQRAADSLVAFEIHTTEGEKVGDVLAEALKEALAARARNSRTCRQRIETSQPGVIIHIRLSCRPGSYRNGVGPTERMINTTSFAMRSRD